MEAEWYKIRDLFTGSNYADQNFAKALSLAKTCTHPDAVWLTSVTKNVDMENINWFAHFMSLDQSDPRTLCFAWSFVLDLAGLLKRSADMGYAFAQAKYELYFGKGKSYAEAACKQGERDGFHALGRYYGKNCDMENFWLVVTKAANLGRIDDMILLAKKCINDNQHKEAIIWYGKVAISTTLRFWFCDYCILYFATSTESNMYIMGKFAKLIIKQRESRLGTVNSRKTKWKCMKKAAEFFDQQVTASRNAIQAWSICAKRLNIIKDMRIFIAKLVWKNRKLGLFTC